MDTLLSVKLLFYVPGQFVSKPQLALNIDIPELWNT